MVKRPKIHPDKVEEVLQRFEDNALAPGDYALIKEILRDVIRIGLVKGTAADRLREVLKRFEENSPE